jgi:hypothetical protein
MSTKRISKNRQRRALFTPTALDAFRRIQQLYDECTCTERDWSPGKYKQWEQCPACDERSQLGTVIAKELNLPVWRWFPCVQHPNTVSPYPKDSDADKNWRPNLEAQQLYRDLEATIDAADRAKV